MEALIQQVPEATWNRWSELFGSWLNEFSEKYGQELAARAASDVVAPVLRLLSRVYDQPLLLKSLVRTFQVVEIEWVEEEEDFVVFGNVMVPVPWFRDVESPAEERREISIKPFVEFAKHVKNVRRILYKHRVNNRKTFQQCAEVWDYAEKHNLPRRFIEDVFFFYFRDLIQYGWWKAQRAPKMFPIRLCKQWKETKEPLANPSYHIYEGLPEEVLLPLFRPRPYRRNRQGEPLWGKDLVDPRPMPYFWFKFIEPLIDQSLRHLISVNDFMYMELEGKPGKLPHKSVFFRVGVRIPLGRFSEWVRNLERRLDSLPHANILTIDPSPSKGAVFLLTDKEGFTSVFSITNSFIREVAGTDTPKLFPMTKKNVYLHHKLLKYYIVYSLAHKCDFVALEYVFSTEKTRHWFFRHGWHKVLRNLFNIVAMRGGFTLFMPPGKKRCPACNRSFSAYRLVGRNEKFGWLAQCPECGYSVPKDMFDAISNAVEFLHRFGFQLHERAVRSLKTHFHPEEPLAVSSHPEVTGNFGVFNNEGLEFGRSTALLPRSAIDESDSDETDDFVITGFEFGTGRRFRFSVSDEIKEVDTNTEDVNGRIEEDDGLDSFTVTGFEFGTGRRFSFSV